MLGTAMLCPMAMGCGGQRDKSLTVREWPLPGYPLDARLNGVQCVVLVAVWIGSNGKVISVRGSGVDPLLVEFAEKNARRWMGGPLGWRAKLPINRTAEYDYQLYRSPSYVVTFTRATMTSPDRVEILSRPVADDYSTAWFKVTRVPPPDYPLADRAENVQGFVAVTVSIEKNGKVTAAGATGSAPDLVRCSAENAMNWTGGPFPRATTFPVIQTVTYEYQLEGVPEAVVPLPPVTMKSPRYIEIVAGRAGGELIGPPPEPR